LTVSEERSGGQGVPLPPVSTTSGAQVETGADVPQIDGYEILGRLGKGGMGTVWKAVQLSTRREVALKVIARGAFASTRAQMRFEREVELAARLTHPNIAEVYDSGLRKGLYYYAMRLVDGVRLDRYVKGATLSKLEIILLMRTVCRAVQHAHQRGVIHRDLKPSNILVTLDGKPYVVDFGLAKAIEAGQEDITVSVDGDIAGTPAFMAPEQAAGRIERIDTRSDVYALGVVLFGLLAGRSPHDLSGSRVQVLQRVATQEVRRPRQIDRSIDRELEAVLLKALAFDRDRRYASAGQLADDLDNYLNGDPLTARKATTLYFLGKLVRKHRLGLGIASVILLAAVGGVVFYIYSIQAEQRRTHRASLRAMAQRHRAEQSAITASQQRALALQTLNRLVFQVQKHLSKGRAQLKLRQDLIDLAVTGLNQVAEAADDPEIGPDRSMAGALLQIGDILRDAGRKSRAREAYEKALARFEALGNDDDVRSQRDICVCRARLGTVCLQVEDLASAATHGQAGLSLARSLAARVPDDQAVLRDCWALHVLAGDVAMRQGETQQAKRQFSDAKALALRLKSTRDLSTTLRRLGDVSLRGGKPQEARTSYEGAVALDREVLSADPDSPAARRHLSVGLGKLAEAHFKAGNSDAARTSCRAALEIIEQLVEADPDRFDTQGDLAATAYMLAQIESKAGNVQEAVAWYRRVISTLGRLEGEGKLADQPRYLDLLGKAKKALAEQ